MTTDVSTDLILIVLAGLGGGLVARFFRVPLLLGYLLAGLLVGPHTIGFRVGNVEVVNRLADIGAALLLFSLGLEFPLKSLQKIRHVAFGGTIVQVVLTFLFCAALGHVIGFSRIATFWFAAAFLSSSTAVILKTLDNQGYSGALSGRIMLGMSIVQDLTVIPVMILLTNYSAAAGNWVEIMLPLLYAVIFVLLMVGIGSRLTPRILGFISKLHSRELFLLVITAMALGVGYLTSKFGLSLAFGAFVAGMVLSESDYSHRALSELGPLRDLFVLIFFVSVGMLCDPVFLLNNLWMVLGVMLLATFGRGMLLFIVTYVFGYRNVVPFAVLFGMLPVSEITFVLIRQGADTGAVDSYLYGLLLNVTVLSMLIGPPMAKLTAPCYRLFRKFHPAPKPLSNHANIDAELIPEIILTGENTIPFIAEQLHRLERQFIVIEPRYPQFTRLKRAGVPAIFGDPSQEAILEAADLGKARMLLLSCPDAASAEVIIIAAHAMVPELPVVLLLENTENYRARAHVTMIEASHAAGLETVWLALIELGWSMPEIHRRLLDQEDCECHNGGSCYDHHGFPKIAQFFDTAEFHIPPDSRLDGCVIRDSALREEYGLLLLGVARAGSFVPFPERDFELLAGDRLLLIGDRQRCAAFRSRIGDPGL